MDYELKYFIAICLIVKIAALSPELSISEETEKLEQIPTRVEASVSPSSTAEKMLAVSTGQYNHRMLFNWESGREKFDTMNNIKNVAKSKRITENQSFDTCERQLKLLRNSLKWRDIRKTLHWLGRILASNKTNVEYCRKRKYLNQKSNFLSNFYSSKTKTRKEISSKKKKTIRIRNFRTNIQTSIDSNPSEKFKKKYWKIHSRKGKSKSKQKQLQCEKKYKKSDMLNFSPTFNYTILKPNSALSDLKKVFFKKTKIKEENFSSQRCSNTSNFVKNRELKATEKVSRKPEEGSKNYTKSWSSKLSLGQQTRDKTAKSLKQKPWPHFVYHRVSSNFFHPDLTGQNHRKSAYIAISVVSDDKSDSKDNNNI